MNSRRPETPFDSPDQPATRRSGSGRKILDLVLHPVTAAGQGEPILNPTRWTSRHRWFVLAGLILAGAAGLLEGIQRGTLGANGSEATRAFAAALIGVAMIGLALSLRGITVPGFLLGGFFIGAGILSWTYTDMGWVVWLLLAIEGIVFAIWTIPWLRDLARLPRLGSAWIGLAYWVFGAISAVLVWKVNVAAGRIVYSGLFILGALAVVNATRKSRRDMSVGVVAAFLVAVGALFIVGSGNALDNAHDVPGNEWGAHQQGRFWGGPHLLYHPNSLAVAAVTIAIRIAADKAFERWQRYAALAAATIVLLLVNSRTGWGYFGAATGLWAVMIAYSRWFKRPIEGMDTFRTARGAWAAAVLPVLLAFAIILGSGGVHFLSQQRYGGGTTSTASALTSGRSSTWSVAWSEFKQDGISQKLFGDAKYVRGYVLREDSSENGLQQPQLTTDDAMVGSARRGGILGGLAFVIGLLVMIWRSLFGVRRGSGRRRPPVWFTLAASCSVITIATADWLLGGTGGTLWVYLMAGEAFLLFGPVQTPLTSVDNGVDAEAGTSRAAAQV
ncbi:hypothetical protein [Rugosimonospora africana]|uniref:hypothetical protein n=1 Tax=Rugosimonospora africana TaxID=556532 RepID=UPI0019404CCD|nr:hypothetical protein [Rugosimonospora africana]